MIGSNKLPVLTMLLFIFLALELNADKIVITTANSSETPLFQKIALFFEEVEREIDLSLDIELLYMPGKRSIIMLESGEIDGDSVRAKDAYENISNVVLVDFPIAFVDYYIYSKKDIVITENTSLLPYRIVVQRGYIAVEKFIESSEFSEVLRVNRIEQCFQMLARDRADILIYSYQAGQDILKSEEFKGSGIKMLTPSIISLPLYIFLNEKHKDLVPHFERAIKKLVESGRYKEILGFAYR